MRLITILYDFTIPECLSYAEGLESERDFYTNCLQFFETSENVQIVCKDGRYISVSELLENNPGEYTCKEIRPTHNILRLFLAGGIEWKESE